MEKMEKVNKKRLEYLLAPHKLAKKELSGHIETYHNKRSKLLNRQISEYHKFMYEEAKQLSQKVAAFRAKHSLEIAKEKISNPKFLSNLMDRHIDDWFDKKRMSELLAGKYIKDQIDNYTHADPYELSGIDQPLILDCSEILSVGMSYTISGVWFGVEQGTLLIELDGSGTIINPHIISWSENHVHFELQDDIGQIPFKTNGRLYLKREDGVQISVNVTVEAKIEWLRAEILFSDSGLMDMSSSYRKELEMTSPELPEIYRIPNGNSYYRPGLQQFDCWDNSIFEFDLSFLGLGEVNVSGPSRFKLLSGPTVSNNRLKIQIRVNDDYYWDYTVRAVFLLEAPQGFPVPDGWT